MEDKAKKVEAEKVSPYQAMKVPANSKARTFEKDEELPPLPLPSLSHTLERYLDSVRPFVSPEEFAKTQSIVKDFQNGVGLHLQEKLKSKAAVSRNWVEEWWLNGAYLMNRQPLLPFCSMVGVTPLNHVGWTFGPGRQIKHTAFYLYYALEFWELLRSERLIPAYSADHKSAFSMSQFRRLFNTARIPLPGRDKLVSHFKTDSEGTCPSHIIILCNGHIYVVDAVDQSSGTLVTVPEWEVHFQHILSESIAEEGPGVGSFTCTDRDTWAKNRIYLEELSQENKEILNMIDTAVLVLSLDPALPTDLSEAGRDCLLSNYKNRWADKSFGIVGFSSGFCGGLADHTAFDGIACMSSMHYTYHALAEVNGQWVGSRTIRPLEYPKKLSFVLDQPMSAELTHTVMAGDISRAKIVIIREECSEFGKKFAVKHRIHPDTFVQLALQLGYYNMHGKPAPCYETATTRAYYNGRTETLRACTEQVVKWVQTMADPSVKAVVKVELMRAAASRHDFLMKEAKENAGCDRHLFGLYCTAMESGVPLPELFSDPAYSKSGGGGNFVLSTSLVNYGPLGGGVAPMCLDGYGIFYGIAPDSFTFTISAMTESRETSAVKYFRFICSALRSMREVLLAVPVPTNKPQPHL